MTDLELEHHYIDDPHVESDLHFEKIQQGIIKKDNEGFQVSFETYIDIRERPCLDEWTTVGCSVYGNLLERLLTDSDGTEAITEFIFAWPTFAVGGSQACTLWYLYQSLHKVVKTSSVCSNSVLFSLSVIGIFLLYLLVGFKDIIHELKVLIYVTEVFDYDKDGKATRNSVSPTSTGARIGLLVVLYELLIFMCVLLIGILYIFTSEKIGDIVQAAVALAFINDVDNVAVSVIYPRKIIEYRRKYRVPNSYLSNDNEEAGLFWQCLGAPVLVCIAVGIVVGVRNDFC